MLARLHRDHARVVLAQLVRGGGGSEEKVWRWKGGGGGEELEDEGEDGSLDGFPHIKIKIGKKLTFPIQFDNELIDTIIKSNTTHKKQ